MGSENERTVMPDKPEHARDNTQPRSCAGGAVSEAEVEAAADAIADWANEQGMPFDESASLGAAIERALMSKQESSR